MISKDRIKLARLYKLEEKILSVFNKAIDTRKFPPYFDRWCKVHKMVGEEIVNLRYKLDLIR